MAPGCHLFPSVVQADLEQRDEDFFDDEEREEEDVVSDEEGEEEQHWPRSPSLISIIRFVRFFFYFCFFLCYPQKSPDDGETRSATPELLPKSGLNATFEENTSTVVLKPNQNFFFTELQISQAQDVIGCITYERYTFKG